MTNKKRRVIVRGYDSAYHCMTRTVNGEHLFGDGAQEVLRKMIRQVAEFSGIEVVTYCVMANHFHVLAYVPYESEVSDVELLRRYRLLYSGKLPPGTLKPEQLEAVLGRGGPEARKVRTKLLARMGDVSVYMKTLKQRFSIWFNRNHDRFGTLWSERFKSVLVEGEREALSTVAAYIDLNPVRAGLVADPKDYRFCGYGEAVAGKNAAIRGLGLALGMIGWNPGKALAGYRQLLYGKGAAPGNKEKDASLSREEAVRVLEKENGKLPLHVLLRCRVRYFTEGVALGSEEYLRGVYSRNRNKGSASDQPFSPNPVKGIRDQNLAVLNALRRAVYS